MMIITSKEEFDALLRERQAILFVFFDWSGQAHDSLRMFEEWEREWSAENPGVSVSFYRLDPDPHPETWGWLAENARGNEGREGGYGSASWILDGKAVGHIRYVAEVGKSTLSRLTAEYFG